MKSKNNSFRKDSRKPTEKREGKKDSRKPAEKREFKKDSRKPTEKREFKKDSRKPTEKRVFEKDSRKPTEKRVFKKDFEKPSPRTSRPKSLDMEERPKKDFRKEAPAKVRNFREKKELFIWGKRTVESYFANLHSQENLVVANYSLHIIVDKAAKAPAQLKPIVESAKALGIKIMSHTSAENEWPLADSVDLNHQRVCLKIPEYPVSQLSDVLSLLKTKVENSEHGCLGLVLDQIQDPRNFGAILRSAAYFGVKFVVYATDRQSDISGLVLKTSAGGAFSLMLVPVVNINRALAQLKEAGAWIIGATLQEKSVEFKQLPKDRNWILVLGNEEKGLRTEVTKNCDYLVKIPGCDGGGVESLNVSVAAGVCMHALQP
ncbi:MAG: 23S rRNA (guanosine(2251)-2'-O)-methyltransferase RlmB [Bdellovibrionota bacterium]